MLQALELWLTDAVTGDEEVSQNVVMFFVVMICLLAAVYVFETTLGTSGIAVGTQYEQLLIDQL